MTHAVPFNTLEYAKKLEAQGVEIKQAEAHAQALAEVLELNFIQKTEAPATSQEVSNKIDSLRSEMNVRFAEVNIRFTEIKSELIKWVLGISAAQAALILSVLKLFH